MLDDKKIKEIEKRVNTYLQERVIIKQKENKYENFFLDNSSKSLNSAQLLYEVSTKENLQEVTGFRSFDGFLWVINASYYSIFYLARALLEREGITFKSEISIHSLTFDAFVKYFYINGKLQKKFIELYLDSKQEASEILGQEKAKDIMVSYMQEKKKRGIFTYEMGKVAIKTKAKTSLDRAKNFNEEIRKIFIE